MKIPRYKQEVSAAYICRNVQPFTGILAMIASLLNGMQNNTIHFFIRENLNADFFCKRVNLAVVFSIII